MDRTCVYCDGFPVVVTTHGTERCPACATAPTAGRN